MMLAKIGDTVLYSGLPQNENDYDHVIIVKLKMFFKKDCEYIVESIIEVDNKIYYRFRNYAYPYPYESFIYKDDRLLFANKYNLK